MAARRQAAHGLDKVPSSPSEWCDAVCKYHLQQRTLAQLCLNGRFSASTVTKEAYLTMRCIWPQRKNANRALEYILDTGALFKTKHVDLGRKLINNGNLGLNTLQMLYELISPLKNPRTPLQYESTLADGLGPFSMLVSLKRHLLVKPGYMPADTPQSLTIGAPKPKRFYDAGRSPLGKGPTSPTPKRSRIEDVDMETDSEMADIASQTSLPSSLDPPASSTTETADDEPARRTPTETLVADFMVTLLGGIACLVQPISPNLLCIANSYETTFKFGPVCSTGQQGSDPVQFRACIDGSIPFAISRGVAPREAIIFEAKWAPRKEGDVSVAAQQSLEHCAYIWQLHAEDQTVMAPSLLPPMQGRITNLSLRLATTKEKYTIPHQAWRACCTYKKFIFICST
ncbi:hypothetical protein AJ80_09819 [Polytolypa hystricis UAMH7299]|uniref:Uncharacterized protein n=1 Tax=Polytolypa hystricis (strain UAMH7299) TaxID=1447883 RepID=A0A2B7WIX5_POLH7|nr:hypothetical protein AJ80_09819 [Polytolypa hystricis UAMH7299]